MSDSRRETLICERQRSRSGSLVRLYLRLLFAKTHTSAFACMRQTRGPLDRPVDRPVDRSVDRCIFIAIVPWTVNFFIKKIP